MAFTPMWATIGVQSVPVRQYMLNGIELLLEVR